MADEQAPELPDPITDPDVKPVNIFEDYRKAKRNTLLWSSLTILASFGTIWPIWAGSDRVGEDITLSWVAGGIAFPPLVVIAVFAVTAIYMRLTFNWADGRMMLSNSPLLFEQSGNELARVLGSVTAEATKARDAIEKAYAEFESSPARETEVRSLVARERTELIAKLPGLDTRLANLATEAKHSKVDDKWSERMMAVLNDVTDMVTTSDEYLRKAPDELAAEHDAALSEGKVQLDRHALKMRDVIIALNDTVGDVAGLHASIATTERVRAFMLDYIPTFTAFWGSMLAAAVAIYFQIYVAPISS